MIVFKKLRWVERFKGMWDAEGPSGKYYVNHTPEGFVAKRPLMGNGSVQIPIGEFDSEEEAKRECQNHLEGWLSVWLEDTSLFKAKLMPLGVRPLQPDSDALDSDVVNYVNGYVSDPSEAVVARAKELGMYPRC